MTVHEAAAGYARRGLRVHPLRPGTKLPLLPAWQERATTDPTPIAVWWDHWPAAGVAIATGVGSGVLVLDVDPRHGGDDTLVTLECHHGLLPSTWRCLTAGGGFHAYWQHPGGRVGNRAGRWPGLDVRGDGGYVVAPPTTLADGHGYAWEIGYAPEELALAPAPAWLLEAPQHAPVGHAPEWWHALVRDGADHGARNDAIARLAGYLLRFHPPYFALELVRSWNTTHCRPPLAVEEVDRTVNSIARREAARREAE